MSLNVRFKGCRIYDVKQRRCGVSNAPKIVRGAHRGHELRPALVGNFFCGAGEENFNETAVKLKNGVPTSHRRRAVSMACCDRPCRFLHHLCVGAAFLHVYTLGEKRKSTTSTIPTAELHVGDKAECREDVVHCFLLSVE